MLDESASDSILKIQNLHKSFGGNHVLRGVSFALPRGTVTALIGSNGAGKSTVLNILSGLFPFDSGTLHLNGIDAGALPAYRRARAGVGRTFQHPRTFQTLTVLEAVIFASTPPRLEALWRNMAWSLWGRSPLAAQATSFAQSCLEKCHLLHKAETRAADLTYGESKLLMLAQAIAFDRDLICLDELCAGLEPALTDQVSELVLELSRQGKTFLFVEHNLEIVRKISKRCVFLHEGIVFRQGPTASVLADPDVVRLYLGD